MNDNAEPSEEAACRQVAQPDGMGKVERLVHHILIPVVRALTPILIALLNHNK